MKRIVLILNANRPDVSCIDFACRVADFHGAQVSGILVESMLEDRYDPKPERIGSQQSRALLSDVELMEPEQALRLFNDTCEHKGLQADAEVIGPGSLPHLVRLSHFADLLVLSPETTLDAKEEEVPSAFARDLLHAAACPVLLAPQSFDGIDETICCYDGSPSSLFALKIYTYLFPGLSKEKLTLLEVGQSEQAVLDQDHRNLMKWAECHYEEARFEQLVGDAREELFQYLFLKRRKMVILGSYGRSLLSTLFRQSTAEKLIRNIDLPMFLSHQ